VASSAARAPADFFAQPQVGERGLVATPDSKSTEVLFYHLERQTLEQILPGLLERTLERGWRAVVQAGSEERLAAIDAHLWTFKDESFLAHGTVKEGFAADQPILLTLDEANPNDAAVRFLVDGARLTDFKSYLRVVLIFDGQDSAALDTARAQWKAAKAQGCAATYWQQTDAGRWEKRA
jgi:DNA polymerase-3 subunit chi